MGIERDIKAAVDKLVELAFPEDESMRKIVYGLALESYWKEEENQRLKKRITELEQELEQGEWGWADIYGPCKEHPKNPNTACFSRVWLPKDDE